MSKRDKCITVYNKNGKELPPCSVKTAWALVTRKRAVYLDESRSSIKILITALDIKRLKKSIIQEAGRICYICGRYIPETEIATVDHLFPKRIDSCENSGLDTKENMACCCKRCNMNKGDVDIITYLHYRIIGFVIIQSMRTKAPITEAILMDALYGEEDAYECDFTTSTLSNVTNTGQFVRPRATSPNTRVCSSSFAYNL